MTLFGWDASHFDGDLSFNRMLAARVSGISFFTHKLGEGLNYTDPVAASSLANARLAQIRYLGGYYVIHQGVDPIAQADRCVAVADAVAPWWRDEPFWFWQCDAERWSSTDRPTRLEIQAFCNRLKSQTGKWVVCYASRGQYGNDLAGLTYPLWNAAYPSEPPGGIQSMYPGDSSPNWRPYSGQEPVFWQYSSTATIAGLTTCDANAYRGTEQDLADLIGGGMALTPGDLDQIFSAVWYRDVDTGTRKLSAGTALLGVYDRPSATVDIEALAAAIVAALPSGGLTPDEVTEACKRALTSLQISVAP